MRTIMKLLSLTILAILAVCGISYLTDKTSYSSWKIINNQGGETSISWAKFEWVNDTLNGKYVENVSMNIPCRLEGLPNIFTFQFDLGANLTGVYENTYCSFYTLNKELESKIKRFKSPIQFWNKNKVFQNFNINFGNYSATNKAGYIYKDYGEKIVAPNLTDTFHLGTIGTDLFKDKVLLIDYPNRQFAICDTMPKGFATTLIDIELDNYGRVILPMTIHNKSYRIMFDNGSSIFPLITEAKNISNFSSLPDSDTMQISSWGQVHSVTGKLIKDTFELGGQKFSNVKFYANPSGLGIDKQTDGSTGNALFWNRIIIIDYKNKKFGVN